MNISEILFTGWVVRWHLEVLFLIKYFYKNIMANGIVVFILSWIPEQK